MCSNSDETFEEPFFELFIWAVLCNKVSGYNEQLA